MFCLTGTNRVFTSEKKKSDIKQFLFIIVVNNLIITLNHSLDLFAMIQWAYMQRAFGLSAVIFKRAYKAHK